MFFRTAGILPAQRRKRNGRHAAAGAQNDGLPAVDRADGVVAAVDDVAVVQEKFIGQPGELFQRVFIRVDHRFRGIVGAGHDQRAFERIKYEMMHRRIRKHDTQRSKVWSKLFQGLELFLHLQQYDRPLAGGQQLFFGLIQLTDFFHPVEVRHHQRKRFVFARLATAQLRDRIRVQRITGQMEAADTFDGNNFARFNKYVPL